MHARTRCYGCGELGHVSKDCPKNKPKPAFGGLTTEAQSASGPSPAPAGKPFFYGATWYDMSEGDEKRESNGGDEREMQDEMEEEEAGEEDQESQDSQAPSEEPRLYDGWWTEEEAEYGLRFKCTICNKFGSYEWDTTANHLRYCHQVNIR